MPTTTEAALRFAGMIQLRSNGAGAKTAPVRVVAYTGAVVDFSDIGLGPVVFDIASITHKTRIPLDWSHDPSNSNGYLNRFDIVPEGLVCSGAISVTDDHTAKL